jgi:hypothetical protein
MTKFEAMLHAVGTMKFYEDKFSQEFKKLAELIGEKEARNAYTKLFAAYAYADELEDAGKDAEADEIAESAESWFAPYQEMLDDVEEQAEAEAFALQDSEDILSELSELEELFGDIFEDDDDEF